MLAVTKYIRIGIGDKNDNPPYFDQEQYEAEVNEDEDIQHTVITVTAKDKDESSKIRYEITGGNKGGAFAVKNETGAIYVAGPLDYEHKKEVRSANYLCQELRASIRVIICDELVKCDGHCAATQDVWRAIIIHRDGFNLLVSRLCWEWCVVEMI